MGQIGRRASRRCERRWTGAMTCSTPAAQAGFRWLAVCAGGSALDAAEALCAQALARSDAAGPFASRKTAPVPIEVILHLANQHLLQRQPAVQSAAQNATQSASERRVTMLATIEEYARERLQERETEQFEAQGGAHAQVYLRMTKTRQRRLGYKRPEQTRWLERLHADLANVRAALRWSVEQHDTSVSASFRRRAVVVLEHDRNAE